MPSGYVNLNSVRISHDEVFQCYRRSAPKQRQQPPVHRFPHRRAAMGRSLAATKDLDEAVEAAQKALKTWSKTSIEERSEYLRKVVEVFTANEQELMEIVMKETGKSARYPNISYTGDLTNAHSDSHGRDRNRKHLPTDSLLQYVPIQPPHTSQILTTCKPKSISKTKSPSKTPPSRSSRHTPRSASSAQSAPGTSRSSSPTSK